MSLLDKNVLPLNLLVLHCFQRVEVGGAIIQHLEKHFEKFTAFKDGRKLLYDWEIRLEKLWKIYNQAISWHIKRKISIIVLAFIWNLLISDFLWKPRH